MAGRSDTSTKMRGGAAAGWRLLLFWEGGSESHEILPDARLVIGRGDDCDLRIPHASVSRRHAVFRGDRGWLIEDLGSSNGTFVGGARVKGGQSRRVEPGHLVAIGDARLVVDEMRGPAPADGESSGVDVPLGEPMQRVLRLVDLVADTTLPVLILGETGVGKGWIAERLHARSSRASAPFVRLNCAAVPEALLESELFGHERGAFTGAVQAKPGILETANGGTVFLDEIGEMPTATQAKLLHVLEHDEVLRVGAVRPRPIDVRFLAATNREVDALISGGELRRDLYFRLAGVPLRVPALRDRAGEIPAMALAFARESFARTNSPVPQISPAAMALLVRHPWPGNLRELRNVVARAALLARAGVVGVDMILFDELGPAGAADPRRSPTQPAPPPLPDPRRSLQDELREHERQCILEALEVVGGHQGKAAERLGISRRTLTNRLNELGLPRPRKGEGKP